MGTEAVLGLLVLPILVIGFVVGLQLISRFEEATERADEARRMDREPAGEEGVDKPNADASLQEHIDWYVRQGYRVVSQTETSAQLIKPKQFSLVWAVIWLLVAFIGIVIYIFYYIAKKDTAVYLTVQSDGTIRVT